MPQENHTKLGTSLLRIGCFALCLAVSAPSAADTVKIKADHPERYVVVKGDTLWDISARFLQDPWRWASVWKSNQQIKNPHLIYPGDVIVLTFVDGQPQLSVLREEILVPTADGEEVIEPVEEVEEVGEERPVLGGTRVKPKVYAEPIKQPIPTISPSAILPFLSEPLAIGKNDLEKSGYITVGLDNRVALGDQSQFYARGLKKNPAEFYQIFRRGEPLSDPDSGELLAYEAIYLGDAKLLREGDPSKLIVTRVKQEILPADRLLVAPERPPIPYYFPRAPEKQVRGRILTALNGLQEFGPSTIVAIGLGKREGIEEGHVLRIMRHVGKHEDPLTRRKYKLPDEETGLLMVFRVFDKVSYALIMDATQPARIHDAVVTP